MSLEADITKAVARWRLRTGLDYSGVIVTLVCARTKAKQYKANFVKVDRGTFGEQVRREKGIIDDHA